MEGSQDQYHMVHPHLAAYCRFVFAVFSIVFLFLFLFLFFSFSFLIFYVAAEKEQNQMFSIVLKNNGEVLEQNEMVFLIVNKRDLHLPCNDV